ncbi:MAG: pyridoxamine 5'-phosphate oxidase family protein [Deltaproteobacteria bacterium]|nr:pyridoxamine 5'-phosphate oxidase family protein [Deltaproteobacteria bacterium]MBW2145213.1 pyridoxamine 5'-phosphate oxidase family protein [Deltaproteobacteria bacterium]
MVKLSNEVVDLLRDPETIKVLTTTDEKGMPHTVFKGSLTALDENNIAFMELLETGNTQRNILRNHWDNKRVAVAVYNQRKNLSYQIKGKPVRFINYGPVWRQFLDQTWAQLPDADPAGVWLIEPEEIINQDYHASRKREEKRVLNQSLWRRFEGKRA